MNKKLLSLYSLKFNPFSTQIPASALWAPPAIENFCWRIQQQVGEGGFALASGDPGTGKSAALRLLCERLSPLRDVTVGVLTRPQASLADFYRELGDLFQVSLAPHNRWASAKVLREKWHTHIETSLYRPVLLIDEAQEMSPAVLSELRLLTSADLDSRSILTVILAGDGRLTAKLDSPDLLPLASRIRSRLRTEASAQAAHLKDMRWKLLRRGSRVRGKARSQLKALAASKLATARAWILKEIFQPFWRYQSLTWARYFLEDWTWRALRSRLEPMQKVARMLRSHEELILNWFRAKGEISSGAVEGLNNKIRVVTRRSYGFRTYDAMEIALYHTLGRLPEPDELTHTFC